MEDINDIQKNGDNGTDALPLSDVFFLTLRHWPWIIVSVVVCVGLAFVYLLRTPNTYTRTAEILIKDDSKGNTSALEEFADFGLFQSNTNISNELTTMMSKDLMEEAVKRLDLDINYMRDGKFHDVIAYGYDLPVKVNLIGFPDEGAISFNLKVDEAGKVDISDLEIPELEIPNVELPTIEDKSKTYTGNLNDTILTDAGKMVVSPTHYYKKDESVELTVKKSPLSDARDSYVERLNVEMSNEKGTILKLSLSDLSIQRADEVLNTLIGVYNENWIRDKNQIAVSTSNFINDRLGVIEGELGNVDNAISSYKSQHLIPDVQAASSMYMTQNQQTETELLAINNQLKMAQYIRQYLAADGNRDQLLPANTGVESGDIQALIAEYNDKILQRNSLVAKSSTSNPLVRTLDEQLAAQRQAIIKTVDNEIVNLNNQLRGLQMNEAQTRSRIASNPSQAKYLLSVERQQKVKESLYLFLLQKREENELSQAFTAYNTRIVNKPGESGIPPKPNRRNILIIAFLIGLAIPFGVTYIREISNTKVRGRKDVENLTLPFLGEIPMADDGKKKKAIDAEDDHTLVVQSGKRDIINESFRVLRTNVEFMKASNIDGANVIAFTSFNPHSGKSFITMNLAQTLALKKRRVLVIDGDMRHGTTSSYVNSPSKGLADYLSGAVTDLDSVIVPEGESGHLFVLPVGTMPPNPAELLESPNFSKMIEQLRLNYDFIMIDCPPIEVVADAQIIDKQVDRTVFILRAGLLERSMLPELEKLYTQKKYKNMAYVLNGTSNHKGRYGYSHNYRYGYGYGYGYGYNYGDDAKTNNK
jgi:capsular exopolysaccharide synthesis family protein